MASTGTVIFHVYTSDASIPVEGATVVVRRQEGPGDLLGLRVTDQSGQTPPLSIPTQDASLGQTPGNLIQPWTGLTVYVEQPEYERVTLDGIQVFPGITTVQNVQLIPLREFDPNFDQDQEFNFTPQPIWEETAYD